MTAFPWTEAMRFGLGVLRLAPREFWAMTPRELAFAHEGLSGRANARPPERGVLEQLIAAFPDQEQTIG